MENKDMNQEQDQALLSLQAELERMAKDIPEMPESFRQGWRQAIRQEARDAQNAEALPEESREARAEPRESEQNQPRAEKIVPLRRPNRWARGLSIAAAAALVLGGALLSQDAISLTRNGWDASGSNQAVLSSDTADQEEAEAAQEETSEAVGSAVDSNEIGAVLMEAAEEAHEMETAAEYDAPYSSAAYTPLPKIDDVMAEAQKKKDEARKLKEDFVSSHATPIPSANAQAKQQARDSIRIIGYSSILLSAVLVILQRILKKREAKKETRDS